MKNINPMAGGCRFSEIIVSTINSRRGMEGISSVFELGCGVGGNLEAFPTEIYRFGVDPMPENVLKAKGVTADVKLGDHTSMLNYPDNRFDLGITCSVIDHIEDCDLALSQIVRVCKELFLWEPIKDSHRKARKGETSRWESTWYHDYDSILKNMDEVKYTIEHFPLYEGNSGPFYHLIHVVKQ